MRAHRRGAETDMSARILVVDDVLANVVLLKAKLTAACYDVVTATSGAEALKIAEREALDLVLLDVMMPEMDGYEVCRRFKASPRLRDIPIVMVTALDQSQDRLRGLEAGADDFLTKPPNDVALFARVRSLVRAKLMIEELRLRNETFRDFLVAGVPEFDSKIGRIVIAEPRAARAEALASMLTRAYGAQCEIATTLREVLSAGASDPNCRPELFIVASVFGATPGHTICSELRARPETRRTAIIVVAEHDDYPSIASALDMGANDYLMRPIDESELLARTRTLIQRERYTAQLRADVDAGIKLAVRDPLTGLHNRRYADQHLRDTLARSAFSGEHVAALLFDLDRFKSINDTYGHAAGDQVLIEFARRMDGALRGVDLRARYGGEEFLAVLPEATTEHCLAAAERVRSAVADKPFVVTDDRAIDVTVSVGVATGSGLAGDDQGPAIFDLLSRADDALYASKANGRNRVTLGGPSALGDPEASDTPPPTKDYLAS